MTAYSAIGWYGIPPTYPYPCVPYPWFQVQPIWYPPYYPMYPYWPQYINTVTCTTTISLNQVKDK